MIPITYQGAENNAYGVFTNKWDIYITPLSQGSGAISEEEAKTVRDRGWEGLV